MKHKDSLEGLIKNFDYELDEGVEQGHSEKWYDVHVSMLFLELCDIRDTLFVFQEVRKEWDKRAEQKAISYSRIRSIVYESLSYRIIMGLSKVFVGKKEFSIEKTINVISQWEMYKEKSGVKLAIKDIRSFLQESELVKNVKEYRDNFFAHLDPDCAMSDIRIYPNWAIANISMEEIEKGMKLVSKLYEECFGSRIEETRAEISPDDILRTFFWM